MKRSIILAVIITFLLATLLIALVFLLSVSILPSPINYATALIILGLATLGVLQAQGGLSETVQFVANLIESLGRKSETDKAEEAFFLRRDALFFSSYCTM